MIETRLQIRDRVTRGVEFLDTEVPDWRDYIDLETLDIASGDNCVLGQVFRALGHDAGESGFIYALMVYGDYFTMGGTEWQDSRAFAFHGTTSYGHEAAVLNRAWRLVLTA